MMKLSRKVIFNNYRMMKEAVSKQKLDGFFI